MEFWAESLASSGESMKETSSVFGSNIGFFKDKFPFYVKYSLGPRGLSPKEVILELYDNSTFWELLFTLAAEYIPTGTSAELDIEFAMKLAQSGFTHFPEVILLKSKSKGVPDGDINQLKIAAITSRPCGLGVNIFLHHHLGVQSIENIDFGDVKLVKNLLRAGYFSLFLSKFDQFSNAFGEKAQWQMMGETAARLLLQVARKPSKYYWASSSESISTVGNSSSYSMLSNNFKFPLI